jgi:hypothetical protein
VEKIIAFMKTWEKYISPDATISKWRVGKYQTLN